MDAPLEVAGRTFRVTCVSMGNPHCVTFVDELTDELVFGIGPVIERDRHFPNRVNAEFVRVLSPGEVRMRVWERGRRDPCLWDRRQRVCVAGVLSGRTEREIVAHLPGGDLRLQWAGDNHVYMTGPAVEVFSGDWPDGT